MSSGGPEYFQCVLKLGVFVFYLNFSFNKTHNKEASKLICLNEHYIKRESKTVDSTRDGATEQSWLKTLLLGPKCWQQQLASLNFTELCTSLINIFGEKCKKVVWPIFSNS